MLIYGQHFNTIKMALKASMSEDVMRVILKMVLECLCGRLGFEEHMSLMHIKIAVRITKVSWKNALDKNKGFFFKSRSSLKRPLMFHVFASCQFVIE